MHQMKRPDRQNSVIVQEKVVVVTVMGDEASVVQIFWSQSSRNGSFRLKWSRSSGRQGTIIARTGGCDVVSLSCRLAAPRATRAVDQTARVMPTGVNLFLIVSTDERLMTCVVSSGRCATAYPPTTNRP